MNETFSFAPIRQRGLILQLLNLKLNVPGEWRKLLTLIKLLTKLENSSSCVRLDIKMNIDTKDSINSCTFYYEDPDGATFNALRFMALFACSRS